MKKKALDFSATKQLLKLLQENNIKIVRKPQDVFEKNLAGMSYHSAIPEQTLKEMAQNTQDFSNALASPGYVHSEKVIAIPRKKDIPTYLSLGVDKDLIEGVTRYPRVTAFHEAGHAFTEDIDNIVEKVRQRGKIFTNIDFNDFKDAEKKLKELQIDAVRTKLDAEYKAESKAHQLLKKFNKENLIALYNKLRTKPIKINNDQFQEGAAGTYIQSFDYIIPDSKKTPEDINLMKKYKQILGLEKTGFLKTKHINLTPEIIKTLLLNSIGVEILSPRIYKKTL